MHNLPADNTDLPSFNSFRCSFTARFLASYRKVYFYSHVAMRFWCDEIFNANLLHSKSVNILKIYQSGAVVTKRVLSLFIGPLCTSIFDIDKFA